MSKARVARVTGFVGALAASATLVGLAATGTGAYFSDTHSGEIDASTGNVSVGITPADGKLAFTNLLPGDYQTQTIHYTATGTGPEDIWLVFPMGPAGGPNPSEAFTGNPSDSAGGGLGRYGHFAVDSPAGSFTSYNLNNPGSGPSCPIDANGHGGSNQQAANRQDHTVAYCAPANAILIDSNVTNGHGGDANLTFGYTPLLTAPQNAPLNKVVSYQIVATQPGIRPDNPNN